MKQQSILILFKTKHIFLCFLVYLVALDVAIAATIAGKVDVLERISDKKWQSVNDHSGVVVYLTGESINSNPVSKSVTMHMENENFAKRVLPIQLGTTVNFTNKDRINHNVWSLSKPKKFDLGSYPAPESKPVTFDKPGLVKLFCNVHPQMISNVLVLKNKYFTQTKEDGSFSISDVPPGEYKLRAWVEGSSPVKKKIKVVKNLDDLNLKVKRKKLKVNKLNKSGKPYKKY